MNAHCLPGKSAFIWTGVGGKKVLTKDFSFGLHMSESTIRININILL